MRKPKSKASRLHFPSSPDVPEWLGETPFDVAYRLAMRDSGDGDYSQVIELTRKEFIIIKVFVAKLRGIPVPTTRPKGFQLAARNGGDAVWIELSPDEIDAVKVSDKLREKVASGD